MTHRILTSMKTFALGAAIRVVAKRPRDLPDGKVEPRMRYMDAHAGFKTPDEWMFDSSDAHVSQEAVSLSMEMSRVSGALSGLRSVLGAISAQAPSGEVREIVLPTAPLLADAELFEGEPMGASYGIVPDEHADLFVEAPAALSDSELRQVA